MAGTVKRPPDVRETSAAPTTAESRKGGQGHVGLPDLPDFDTDFVDRDGMAMFAAALTSHDGSGMLSDANTPSEHPTGPEFISSLNDWSPVRERVRRRRSYKEPPLRRDETREGIVYNVLKWPLLIFVAGWLAVLAVLYLLTRFYIYLYENFITWRGHRQVLRQKLRSAETYQEWIAIAQELDKYLGNDKWMEKDEYGYYNSKTIRRVGTYLSALRKQAAEDEVTYSPDKAKDSNSAVEQLKSLLEACVKANFVGVENPGLYSEAYYGTKRLVQLYTDELEAALSFILSTRQLDRPAKRVFFRHLHVNFGRSALCLSGGATFAYYHFGVAKALLDGDVLPNVISGTSGGALVAALLATRTDSELRKLLVPELADKITACHDDVWTWLPRWWKTGARFDAVDWAARASWFCRGNMTFKEAFERTGRILNVTCVPSDPHSPTMLVNHLTAPDCVIWSAVLASAAVPGILNPVILMRKVHFPDGKKTQLMPFSFGHKWKDGSLRTDIPIRALNLNFGVHFPIVSQVNPHVSLFFFSSRGSVGRPVTHRRGRGWRGGFLGSATEQYLKLDLTKWLKVLRHLELLPRPLGQDWSGVWLQKFSGTVTIWPKSVLLEDLVHILSDPSRQRLGRMIRGGMVATWPKLLFVQNRMRIEHLIEKGRKLNRAGASQDDGSVGGERPVPLPFLPDDDWGRLVAETGGTGSSGRYHRATTSAATTTTTDEDSSLLSSDDDEYSNETGGLEGPIGDIDGGEAAVSAFATEPDRFGAVAPADFRFPAAGSEVSSGGDGGGGGGDGVDGGSAVVESSSMGPSRPAVEPRGPTPVATSPGSDKGASGGRRTYSIGEIIVRGGPELEGIQEEAREKRMEEAWRMSGCGPSSPSG